MPGRHQAMPRRRRLGLRLLVGVAGGAVVGATLLSFASAGATTDPVGATFGVTGVATSNCKVSTGGTDVWVSPGQELDVKSSVVGLTVLGLPLDLSKIASLDGALVIDPGSANPINLDITNTVQKVTGLTTGNHAWKWTVSSVKLLGGLSVPLNLSSSAVSAGAKLTWTGTIHVSSAAANCGIAVQLPSVSASVSVTGLPPIAVGIPGVKVSVPVNVPSLGGSLPVIGGNKSTGNTGGHSSAPATTANNPIPVPARVVPGINGGGLLGGGNAGGGLVPGADQNAGGGSQPTGAAGSSAAPKAGPSQDSTGKHKTIDLAASPSSSTGEVWVVLAIVAVIALAFVAATYARLYLIKREGS
jgi:hypothetical protein